MFGSTGSWYYSSLAGLKRAAGSRSWSKPLVEPPRPTEALLHHLTWANATIDTPMGPISSAWSVLPRDKSYQAERQTQYSLHTTFPPNSQGRILLPISSLATLQEGSVVIWKNGMVTDAMVTVPGIKNVKAGENGHTIVVDVGSGTYSFTAVGSQLY